MAISFEAADDMNAGRVPHIEHFGCVFDSNELHYDHFYQPSLHQVGDSAVLPAPEGDLSVPVVPQRQV